MCVLSIKVPIRKKSGYLFNGPRIYIYIYIYIYILEGQLKNLFVDQNILKECHKMSFIFQHSHPCRLHISLIDVRGARFHWAKTSWATDMTSLYELSSLLTFQPDIILYIYIYIYINAMQMFHCRWKRF